MSTTCDAVRKSHAAAWAGFLIAVVLGAGACSRHSSDGQLKPAAAASKKPLDDAVGYPRGTWRVDPETMRHVLLSYAEILVSFDGAEAPHAFPLSVHRSRAEALMRAQNVAGLAKERPKEFGALAERYSDDPVSRSLGGYAGVFRASRVPATIVDALRVLHDGDISRVIETEFGYYIVERLKVPPDQTFSADEVVIQHRELRPQWRRPGRDVQRTRAEALAEANRVAALARSNPDGFTDLVRSSSDSYDAVADGDLGVWSLYHPLPSAELATVVSRLEVGSTATIEDGGGFHVVRRKAPTDRQWLQSEEIIVTHSASSLSMGDAPTTRSRETARTLSLWVLGQWKRHPASYAALAGKYCGQYRCKHARPAWRAGSGIPGLDGAIAALRVGEIARAPIETPIGFHLIRRIAVADKDTRTDEKVSFEVVDPGLQNATFFFERAAPQTLAAATLAFKPIAMQKLGLTGDKGAEFGKILDDLAESLRNEPAERRSAIREAAQRSLLALLGQSDYARYVEARDAWVKDQQERL